MPETFIGLSGYPTSIAELDSIINELNARRANVYRMSANPEWFRSKPHPYREEYVAYMLEHWDGYIVVDRNHIYPPNESGASDLRSNMEQAKNSLLEVCAAFPNNPRVMVELLNEYVSIDFQQTTQTLINAIRNAGYTNPIVVNKWNTGWSTYPTDPKSNLYGGMHFYFNSWSVSGALSQMNYALSQVQSGKLKGVINTELGADYNEASQFSSSEVQELNNFLSECAAKGIGNCIWMNENLSNIRRYTELGLNMPIGSTPEEPQEEPPEEEPEEPQEPPAPTIPKTIKLSLKCPHCKEVIFETEADVEPV